MVSEGALLALIIDDSTAMRVLAAWAALELPLASIDSDEVTERIRALVDVRAADIKRSLVKLNAARVLVDGGISEMADKMLQTRVQQHLNGRGKKR